MKSDSEMDKPHVTSDKLDSNIGVKNEWVIRNDINVIWLPAEYRPTRYAVYQSMPDMRHASGRVTRSSHYYEVGLIILSYCRYFILPHFS